MSAILDLPEANAMKITDQQRFLGWEHIDLADYAFRCKWFRPMRLHRMGVTISGAPHEHVTNALRFNGNVSACWVAEGFQREEVCYGTWVLIDKGVVRAVLTVDYISRTTPGITIQSTPIVAEKGARGRIPQLHDFIASGK